MEGGLRSAERSPSPARQRGGDAQVTARIASSGTTRETSSPACVHSTMSFPSGRVRSSSIQTSSSSRTPRCIQATVTV